MDMYQKRKMRQENKSKESQNNTGTRNINWYIPTNVKPLANLYK